MYAERPKETKTAQLLKYFVLFGMGGVAYIVIEMLWRGYSHWSMFMLGGMCFLVIGFINEQSRGRLPLLSQMAIGSAAITALEFLTGYVVNIKLGMNVWSYYDMPYNIMGQICLEYTVMWFFLSAGCIFADDYLRYRLFGEEKPHYRLL